MKDAEKQIAEKLAEIGRSEAKMSQIARTPLTKMSEEGSDDFEMAANENEILHEQLDQLGKNLKDAQINFKIEQWRVNGCQ